MPSRAWVVTCIEISNESDLDKFQCPLGLELLRHCRRLWGPGTLCFNALSGLSCYLHCNSDVTESNCVSMPSRAWVVTARMPNILNFSWCFLCIPAIYRCILAHLPIFFNQLSKFLRCESPSTFLGTCLSHHSFIIFLVTNTNTLLSGLYLISTVPLQKPRFYAVSRACFCRYLSEYSDNSSFSCMLTFWTYLMRYTYPWHWTKYSTKYNRCHPIFSLSW